VLLAATFFPARASKVALAATADVQESQFERTIEQLVDLALLNPQRDDLDSISWYVLHPLVRAFAEARLEEWPEFEHAARTRWVAWYASFVSGANFAESWNAPINLAKLDAEQETIDAVIRWAGARRLYHAMIQLARGVEYYYYIHGLWDEKLAMHLLYAEAARSLGSHVDEFDALALHIQLLSRQGNCQEAEQYLPRFHELSQSITLSADLYFTYYHTLALYWMSQNDLNAAHDAWSQSLAQASGFSAHSKIGNLQWLATCLYGQGKLAEAQELYKESFAEAIKQNYQRFILINQFRLAMIDLDQGNLTDAAERLAAANVTAQDLQDREHFARIHRLEARLHVLRGDMSAAKRSLVAAIDLFERLGLRQELAEARAALPQLEVTEAANVI